MTTVAILIPSHIHYDTQIDLLDKCIKSLIEQTYKTNIYASISFSNDIYKKEFSEKILLKYGKNIKFIFSKDQMYQMEHLYKLWLVIVDKKYDMVMFCDDDDIYNVNRVETFINAFEYGKINIKDLAGVKEIIGSNKPECEIPEYWCYGVIPDVLYDFYSNFNNKNYNLLKHKFGDMYFRHYLRKNKKHINWLGLNISDKKDKLYYYNINNPNSICGSLHKNNNIYDQILLQVLDCRNYNDFTTIINKYKMNEENIIKSFKFIYEFCKLLYK